jgi:hypothetical protein
VSAPPPSLIQDAQEAAAAARPLFGEGELLRHLIASAALLAVLLVLRVVVRRALSRADWKDDAARARTQANLGRAAMLALVLGLLVIWAPELHAFALSAVALAAAIVLATKELIMGVSGAVLRATTAAYDLGDRIEIDGVRGDVIRIGLLSTTVLEVGPSHQRTGRTVVLPNSLLLAKPVANESHAEGFVLHSFAVPLAREADWRGSEERLLAIARDVCQPWSERVREAMERLAREHGLPPPQTEVRASVQLAEAGRVDLLLRVPVPARSKAGVEQEILRRYLAPAPGSV